jgi:hypothetical protein
MPPKFTVLSYKTANKNIIRVFQNGNFLLIPAVIDIIYPNDIPQAVKVALIIRAGIL